MSSDVRQPAVAGTFYPADPVALKKQLDSFLFPIRNKIHAKGIVVPHAGYIYSGAVAGNVFSHIEIPHKIIILSPNHTGLGVPFSINAQGAWKTPLGDAKIDTELAERLIAAFPLLKEDAQAHSREHSLEVQLPFLQYLKNDFSFVPITIAHVGFEACEQFGEAIAQVIIEEKQRVLIVASSDMNHYAEHEYTLRVDQLAIDEMLKRDAASLYKTVHQNNISMCGIIPTTAMLTAANLLGASKATLIDHTTSGPVSGDFEKVVGYAGVIVE